MFILILILLILIIIIYLNITKPTNTEPFDHSISTQGSKFESTLRRPYRGVYNSRFNGRMAIDDQYFFDAVYDDVTYYSNIYADHDKLNQIQSSGMENCFRECPGYCVEVNVSSNAMCFPY
jgi:hypothetical protein